MRAAPLVPAGPHPRGTAALRALLTAAILPGAFGAELPTPFGMPRWLAGLVVGVVVVALAVRAWRRSATAARAAMRFVAWMGALVAAAAGAELVVRLRATGFYTGAIVADVMAVLLATHAFGVTCEWVARSSSPRGAQPANPDAGADAWRRRRRRLVPDLPLGTAARLDGVAAVLVAGFWSLAALALRELAGVVLIAAAGAVLAAVPVRVALAWERTEEESRRARRIGFIGLRTRRSP